MSLETSALFNVRLVCKSCEEASDPFPFEQIYISNLKADLEVANTTLVAIFIRDLYVYCIKSPSTFKWIASGRILSIARTHQRL